MQDSESVESCSICLERLAGRQLGVCIGSNGRRACLHYFHLHCLRKVEGAHCPQCRARFCRRAPLADILKDFSNWCSMVSMDEWRENCELLPRELLAALRAMLPLPAESVNALIEKTLFNHSPTDRISVSSLWKIVGDVQNLLPDEEALEFHQDPAQVKITESETFKHESQDGHSGPGIVCRCGQVHVRRGDRIRRGAQKLDVDSHEIVAGNLGTIARVGPRQESVIIKWDRSPPEKVHSYTWPDPEGRVLLPVAFREIAADISCLLSHTGLSSVAAEELLTRTCGSCRSCGSCREACDAYDREPQGAREECLRKDPKLFHQVRILPDATLVQQWFDAIPPCQCNNARCRGGVHWSSEAEKHLGREGILLKMDKDDDTVLIETVGPCTCRVWFPRLAVEPVYNIDLNELPLFEVSNRVECRMEEGWSKGIVEQVLWHGADRHGPCPYTVRLDDGRSIFVPNVNLIRKSREIV